MVEVFKTNVQEVSQAKQLAAILLQHLPGSRIDFDLDDCDKILRIEGAHIAPEKITHLLNTHDCICEVLE